MRESKQVDLPPFYFSTEGMITAARNQLSEKKHNDARAIADANVVRLFWGFAYMKEIFISTYIEQNVKYRIYDKLENREIR